MHCDLSPDSGSPFYPLDDHPPPPKIDLPRRRRIGGDLPATSIARGCSYQKSRSQKWAPCYAQHPIETPFGPSMSASSQSRRAPAQRFGHEKIAAASQEGLDISSGPSAAISESHQNRHIRLTREKNPQAGVYPTYYVVVLLRKVRCFLHRAGTIFQVELEKPCHPILHSSCHHPVFPR
jgi:hypothetical protein